MSRQSRDLDSSSVSDDYSHDVFISHASEDKNRFVRPLAEALRARGASVWYDEWELQVASPSLTESTRDSAGRSSELSC